MITLPTLSQLYTGIITDLETQYGVNISLTQRVALRAIAAVQSGKLWLIYKVIGFLQKNIWPDTADSESKGGTLERFGRTRLNRNPRQAIAGQYTVTVTGTIGATVPAQATFKSNDTSLHPGFIFILDSAHVMVTASDSITLRALTAGEDAKLAIGDTLTITSPAALINNTVTVTVESTQPIAAEDIEAYRSAVVQSFRLEAQGGASADYRIWSSDAAGVRIVYPYAKPGEDNANNIYVEAELVDSTDGKGTPTQAILDDVEAVTNFSPDTTLPIDERGRRPNTVANYFLPVTIKTINVTITGFAGITNAQKSLILSALTSFIYQVRPFVAAADALADKNDILSVNNINGIIYAQIPNAVYTSASMTVNGSSVSSYTFVLGNIPYLNSITYN